MIGLTIGEGGVEKYYRIGAAALAWFAILLQYYLTVTKPGAPFIEATVRYFSFFTILILTNLLVALGLRFPGLRLTRGSGPSSRGPRCARRS